MMEDTWNIMFGYPNLDAQCQATRSILNEDDFRCDFLDCCVLDVLVMVLLRQK